MPSRFSGRALTWAGHLPRQSSEASGGQSVDDDTDRTPTSFVKTVENRGFGRIHGSHLLVAPNHRHKEASDALFCTHDHDITSPQVVVMNNSIRPGPRSNEYPPSSTTHLQRRVDCTIASV